VIQLKRHWSGQPYDASLQLVDSVISYQDYNAANTVIEMEAGGNGRSFYFDNCYVERAERVWSMEALANTGGWMHYSRLAFEVVPSVRDWGQAREPVYLEGVSSGSLLNESTSGVAPPSGLVEAHRLPADFPTWETPTAVNVSNLGIVGDGVTDVWAALQQAIVDHEVLFFPKGHYRVSKTLDLRADSKLIGVSHMLSVLQPISTLTERFNGVSESDPDAPLLRTVDADNANTYLGFLHLLRTYSLENHNPTSVGNYVLEWRCAGDSLVRQIKVEGDPSKNIRPDLVASSYYGLSQSIDQNYPQDSFPQGMWAWPVKYPTVQIRGHGGGRWFTLWVHGRQALRETVPFLLVENTQQPLQFYHMHLQQQDSLNHAEFRNADNVTVYGTKGEIKGSMLYFSNCDNVRLFGHGGLSSPDPSRNPPYLFQFINCTNFLVSGIGDTINQGSGDWQGGAYDRWYHANNLSFSPLLDRHYAHSEVVVPPEDRPILYLRGAPTAGVHPDQSSNQAPFVRIETPTNGASVANGAAVSLSALAIDREDGDLAPIAVWNSSIDGALGTGGSLSLANLSVGQHSIHVSITDSLGLVATDAITLTVVSVTASQTVTLQPVADSYIRSDSPTGNYGTESKLRHRVNEGSSSIYRFDLSTVGGVVLEAKLRLAAAAADSGTLQIYGLEALGWLENTVSYNTRPGLGDVLGSITLDGVSGNYQELDVGEYVAQEAASGAVGFSAVNETSALLRLYAREGSEPPELVVTYTLGSANQAPVVEILSPADSASTIEGTLLHFTATASDAEDGDLSGVLIWSSDLDGPLGSSGSISSSALSAGDHTITATVTDSSGMGSNDSILLTVQTRFTAWSEFQSLSGNNALPESDPDRDGFSNFLEYALGLDPKDGGDAAGVPSATLVGGYLQLRFHRIADPEISYSVWASTDLSDWGEAPVWSSTGTQNVAGEVVIEDVIGVDSQETRFLRLQVE
jgi:hypothetical protein